MFAKVMSIPDDLMREWFELLTDRPTDEIGRLANAQATHPRQAKEVLGKDIVMSYHGEAAADAAAAEWQRRFSQRQDPTEIPEVSIQASDLPEGKLWICKLLVKAGLAPSNSEARRLIQQGGVTLGPERTKVADPQMNLAITSGLIVRVGNRKVVQLRVDSSE
jgi:tyrosyl-tRNA synthetase